MAFQANRHEDKGRLDLLLNGSAGANVSDGSTAATRMEQQPRSAEPSVVSLKSLVPSVATSTITVRSNQSNNNNSGKRQALHHTDNLGINSKSASADVVPFLYQNFEVSEQLDD